MGFFNEILRAVPHREKLPSMDLLKKNEQCDPKKNPSVDQQKGRNS